MKDAKWFILIFLGIAIVYLTHLGKIPVHATADECRRALVPLEMYITGDYLSPTLNGELYLNKPPLFNWIVASSYHLFGDPSAFALRLPVVLSILIHGLLIFYIVRKYTDPTVAALAALGFMTNGRTLIHDSMLGLLEHTLALFMYTGLMLIFILGEKKKYVWLFVLSYFMAAIGFLIKGMPALAHHGIALVTYFIFSKKCKILFSAGHILGILVFMATLAMYYIPFISVNDVSAGDIFFRLWNESSKRYEVEGLHKFVNVLIDYPLDFIKHFLPWTLLLLVLIRKNIRNVVRENRFVYFNALLFLVNTPVYWLAALKNPHYLYFMLPLFYTVLFYVWSKTTSGDWQKMSIEILFFIGLAAAFIVSIILPFNDWVAGIQEVKLKSASLAILFLLCLFLYWKFADRRLLVVAAALVVIRFGFNWFVIPQRIADQKIYQTDALAVHQIVKDSPLYIMAEYPAGYYDGITYNMEKLRKEILRINMKVDAAAFYLVDGSNQGQFTNDILYQFPYTFADNHQSFSQHMYLVKFK